MLKRIHWLSFLLVFILLFAGCGTASQSATDNTKTTDIPDDYAYTMLVTINPELKLYMDESDKIIAVEYLNDDAEAAYSNEEIVGLTLADGLADIVESAIEKEYLQDGKDITVEIGETKSDVVNTDTVLSSANSAIVTVLTEKKITANVITKAESVTTAAANNTATNVNKCATCGGTGECQGCHGGRDECPACSGSGTEVCGNCDASGMQVCPNRHSCVNGKCTCVNCQGSGTATCSNCGGSGKNRTDGTSVCPVCNGAGKQTCLICNGKGYEICNICNGSGKTTCEVCNGKHTWTCSHCKGAGTAKDCPDCNGSFKCQACNGTGAL